MLSRTTYNNSSIWVDTPMTFVVVLLCVFGLLMVASSSLEIADREYNDAMHFIRKQFVSLALALALAVAVYFVAADFWLDKSLWFYALAVFLLTLVLVAGYEVNGSRRWLRLGGMFAQPSEAAKLAVILFTANYVARRGHEMRTTFYGVVKPVAVASVLALLLLLEPDYGAAGIIFVITVGMLFLAGVKIRIFASCAALVTGFMYLLLYASPYRRARVEAFLDPWSDPFNSGYQLTQSFIAIGQGSWFGQGLGDSVQKQFYLPEAHTDFIFSVIAEELGFIAVVAVILCYLAVVWRCFVIAGHAERQAMRGGAYAAYGIGIWLGGQAFTNIGVAMGVLPTKGFTLPLISAGGSSMLITFIAIALVQRIHHEACCADKVSMWHYQQRKRHGQP